MKPGQTLDDARLRRLLEVGRGLVAELDVETVLQQVLDVARELTGARYAAVGVLDPSGKRLERFITAGIDPATHRAIGVLPQGRGVLGVLIEDPEPLRLADVGAHPKSYGFPPGHPPMHTFLGVPMRIRGEVFGNLYLTDKEHGEFEEQDEEAISVLADWAAIAIDNARAYAGELARRTELERVVGGLEATIDISRALGGETDLDRVLELIVKRARALIDTRTVLILLVDEAGSQMTVAALAGVGADSGLLGEHVAVQGTPAGRVLSTGKPCRVDERDPMPTVLLDRLNSARELLVPLVYRGEALGVLAVFDHVEREFTTEDELLLESFATSAATAVATAQRVAEQGLRRSIEASERERTRWARELHDETLQELAGLKVLLNAAGEDHEQVIPAAIEQIEMTITGLRHLVTELRPAALDEYGLAAAVEALVLRLSGVSGIDITTDIALHFDEGGAETRHEQEVESTLYRLVQEGLNNAVRHANPERVRVTISERADAVVVVVRDDGAGFEASARNDGFGLRGMQERIALVGGTLDIASAPGSGTTITASVPARRRARTENDAMTAETTVPAVEIRG